jgi:hypothetical protein
VQLVYVVLIQAPIVQPSFVWKQLMMEGFIVRRWTDRWEEGINHNLQLIKDVSKNLSINTYCFQRKIMYGK